MAEIYYGTGKRKDAVARVYMTPGSGRFTVNGRELEEYFPRQAHQKAARASMSHPSVTSTFDVKVTAHGGGITGQAEAIRHGIAVALVNMNEELRVSMREIGAMTRDPRVKERKKYGHKRARRGFQFSKR